MRKLMLLAVCAVAFMGAAQPPIVTPGMRVEARPEIRTKAWDPPGEAQSEGAMPFETHEALTKLPTQKLIALFASSAAILKQRGYTAKQLADALGDDSQPSQKPKFRRKESP